MTSSATQRPTLYRVVGTYVAILMLVGGGLIAAGAYVGRLHAAGQARREAQAMVNRIRLQLPDVTLVDQDGKPWSTERLRGQVWVACCFFTRCSTVCPALMHSLQSLAERLRQLQDVRFLTVTVDPEHDRPGVLRAYAQAVKADSSRWVFVTGKQEAVYRLVREGFRLSAAQTPLKLQRQGADPVTHSSRLVLLDKQGRVRGYADSQDPWELTKLQYAIELLLAER